MGLVPCPKSATTDAGDSMTINFATLPPAVCVSNKRPESERGLLSPSWLNQSELGRGPVLGD